MTNPSLRDLCHHRALAVPGQIPGCRNMLNCIYETGSHVRMKHHQADLMRKKTLCASSEKLLTRRPKNKNQQWINTFNVHFQNLICGQNMISVLLKTSIHPSVHSLLKKKNIFTRIKKVLKNCHSRETIWNHSLTIEVSDCPNFCFLYFVGRDRIFSWMLPQQNLSIA